MKPWLYGTAALPPIMRGCLAPPFEPLAAGGIGRAALPPVGSASVAGPDRRCRASKVWKRHLPTGRAETKPGWDRSDLFIASSPLPDRYQPGMGASDYCCSDFPIPPAGRLVHLPPPLAQLRGL